MSEFARIGTLRQVLAQPPSGWAWGQLLAYIEQWHKHEAFEVDLGYIEDHLALWPDRLREILPQHKRLLLVSSPPSFFRLFRSLDIAHDDFSELEDTPLHQDSLEWLFYTKNMSHITQLTIRRHELAPPEFEALTNSRMLAGLKALTLHKQWYESRLIKALLTSPHLGQLVHLDLSHSHIRDKYALLLAKTGHPNIRRLLLNEAQIDIRGVQALLGSLMWPSLSQLSLQKNRFGHIPRESRNQSSFQDPFTFSPQIELTSLDVGQNQLHPSQGDAMIERGYLERLTTLSVEGSDFSHDFTASVLARHERLPFEQLNLRNLRDIGLPEAQKLVTMGQKMTSLRFPFPLPGIDMEIEQFALAHWPDVPGSKEEKSQVPQLRYTAHHLMGEESENRNAWGYNLQEGLFALACGTGEGDAGDAFAQCLVGGLVAWAQATGVKGEHWQMNPSHHIDEWRPWRMDLAQTDSDEPFDHPLQWLLYRTVHLARLLLDLHGEAIEYVGAQSSLLAVQFWGQQLGLVHVGFEKLLRYRDGTWESLTHGMSHSDQNSLDGIIPDNTYMMSLNERAYLPALGNPMTRTATVQIEETREGDAYLLCARDIGDALLTTTEEIVPTPAHLDDWLRAILNASTRGLATMETTAILVSVGELEDT